MNIVTGLGTAETACFRDIFKVARSFISDRVLAVRLAATQVNCQEILLCLLADKFIDLAPVFSN